MLQKIKKFTLYLLAIYAIFGFILVPFVLKPQLINLVEKQTNAKLACEKISFNPFLCQISLHNVVLSNLKKEKIIAFKRFSLNLELYSLVHGAIHFKEITLVKPQVYLVYEKNKTFNILKIIKESKTEPKEEKSDSSLPRIIVDKLSLVNGLVSYKDFTLKQTFDFAFNRINFTLKNIDTKNISSSDAQLRFHTTLEDGGFFDLKSKITSLEPFITEGQVNFEASKLYTEWKYLQEKLNLEVADGKISFSSNYYFNLADLNKSKISELNLAFDKIRIKPKNKPQDILNLKHGCIKNATIYPLQRKVNVESICLNSLNVKVQRKENKEIDWMAYVKTNFAETKTEKTTPTKSTKPWDVLVQNIKLEKIGVAFTDKAVKPNVITNLKEFNFYAKNATLLGEKPMDYNLNLLLNEHFQCNANGFIVHKDLDVQTNLFCKNFDIVHYKPYINQVAKQELKSYNLDLKKASLDFDVDVKIKNVDDKITVLVKDSNLSLNTLELNKDSTKEKLLGFKEFKINGIFVDTLKKELLLRDVKLNGLALNIKRYKNKKLNLENLVQAKKTKTKGKKKADAPYSIKVKHFALAGAKVAFRDNALSPSRTNTIDKINLNLSNLDMKKKTWLDYTLAMRVNKKGKISSKGKIEHTPLAQKGSIKLSKISLKELTPYIQEKAFVNIDDGAISLSLKTNYKKRKNKPDLSVNGAFKLENLYAVDSRDKSPLCAFSKIDLNSFTLELFPNRFYTDKIDIDSFYVDVLIDKNKKMNFAKLLKVQDSNSSELSKEEEEVKEVSFPIKIAKVDITEGNARFADLSIPLQFRTDIHNLKGVIYSISNIGEDTTTVNLNGEVNDYGLMKLSGALNALKPKKYMDLNLNFKNLALDSFSGYSASFAGYEIDGGKLYLDLGYKIDNAQLEATNSIIIKKIKLGKENEDDNVTKLPLGFVIALLEDSDGIIDINMPIEGDLDKPDFKYGALVWKTLGGLIAKAVTSPFRLLGSMMGIDGNALENLDFEAGSYEILPTEREKLDNLAKMMMKRPKIKLALTPSYDVLKDKEAMQLAKLIDLVLKRSGITNKQDHKNAMTVGMLEEIYDDAKDDDALEKIKVELEKEYPDNKEAFAKAYLYKLGKLDASLQVVTQEELEKLALKRVEESKKYLVSLKGVNPQRIVKNKLLKINDSKDKLIQMPLKIEVK